MKYKIAICDDSPVDRQYILNAVNKWALSSGALISADTFPSAESFLFSYEEKSDYDILLLDIEMGAINGVELAKKLRLGNDTVQIIFITGYSDYISEGYDVDALNYLLKPVNPEKLFCVLDRAAKKLKKNEKVLFFEVGGETVRVPIHRIRYADVLGNYVTLHATSDITVKMTLKDLENMLDERFLRVGRCAIVNLTKISRVTKAEVKLDTGDTVPLPRGAYESVNRAIINLR